MNTKALERLSPRDQEKLEKYIKVFVAKIPQIVVQSRCGQRRKRTSGGNTLDNDVYEISIEDNSEIQQKFKDAWCDISPLTEFSLNIEMLLKTHDGDILVLEEWNVHQVFSETFWDPKHKVYANMENIHSHLLMLLKSVISVTRVIPGFKLSLGQPLNYVILYRIYSGEPQTSQLGVNPSKNKIGEVHTQIGTITVSVAYRSSSEMAIEAKSAEKENSFMVKSDYFNLDLSPKRQSSAPRAIKSRVLRNNSNSQNVGAFAHCDSAPDPLPPELEFLHQKIFPSHLLQENENEDTNENENLKSDLNLNLEAFPEIKEDVKDVVKETELSLSDSSDSSEFVVLEMKPPFATCDPDSDLSELYQNCQLAPSTLPSFSDPTPLQQDVLDVTSQIEKFELSMMGYDNFVDSFPSNSNN